MPLYAQLVFTASVYVFVIPINTGKTYFYTRMYTTSNTYAHIFPKIGGQIHVRISLYESQGQIFQRFVALLVFIGVTNMYTYSNTYTVSIRNQITTFPINVFPGRFPKHF